MADKRIDRAAERILYVIAGFWFPWVTVTIISMQRDLIRFENKNSVIVRMSQLEPSPKPSQEIRK